MIQEPLQPGTTLKDKYRVLQIIGGGGMALVYCVEELGSHGQRWALKELRPMSGAVDELEEAQALFRQEAEMLAGLDHPNLPAVVDFFDEWGRSYLVMELIEGHSLQKHLELACSQASPSSLGESRVLTWIVQVCEVLEYLHTRSPPVIFRDLKPSNIMVSDAGVIKLIDFGIARTYKAGQHSDTMIMGSENFAPPEQWGGDQTDARSDIYALGATMYHLLTATPPPMAFMPGAIPSVRKLNPRLSPATEDVVGKAMAKDRADRYETAHAMAQALECSLELLESGTAQTVVCPSCGYGNRPVSRFCGRCGVHMSGLLRAVLRLMARTGSQWEIPISKDSFLIGRSSVFAGVYPDLDLTDHDRTYISRRHAHISQGTAGFTVVDLGSVNGTYVNELKLAPNAPYVLHNGDRLGIGRVELVFCLDT